MSFFIRILTVYKNTYCLLINAPDKEWKSEDSKKLNINNCNKILKLSFIQKLSNLILQIFL